MTADKINDDDEDDDDNSSNDNKTVLQITLSATMNVPTPNTRNHGSCACTKLASLTRPRKTSVTSTI